MIYNVLIFPAEGENATELCNALSTCVNIQLFGASSTERTGGYAFARYTSQLPPISAPDFNEQFESYLQTNHIHVVFSTHDTVSLYLAENQKHFSAHILNSDPRTTRICRDKGLTYQLFNDQPFCPKLYTQPQHFPCFAKPRNGQGGIGAFLMKSPEDVPSIDDWSPYVVTEYLPGEELTIDCLTDAQGRLLAVLPRTRDAILGGICTQGKTLLVDKEIQSIANTINQSLTMEGLWYFQLKRSISGRLKLLEVSTRCAGTMCLSRARGVNLPLLSVYIAMGLPVTAEENPYPLAMSRTLMPRYRLDYQYDTLYVDYDDTLIVRNRVYGPLLQLLHQCRDNGKRIILISRHNQDHTNTLEQDLDLHAISPLLFHRICHLSFDQRKSDLIPPNSPSIFIDNANKERALVRQQCHIPVFDVDQATTLLDWRIY